MPQKTTKTQTTNPSHPMEALLLKGTLSNIHKGNETEARILSLSRKNVLFDIGAKAYAVLGEKELKEISDKIAECNAIIQYYRINFDGSQAQFNKWSQAKKDWVKLDKKFADKKRQYFKLKKPDLSINSLSK